VSDAATQSLKISREGIVLIKSFEGFRPRATRREDGGWIIGYGHTLSAREGASVSEADAELLLRYDLLPVEKSVNETTAPRLNQHQFDALVSFAFSVGLERFTTSDVRQRLISGAAAEAADAMIGWPETPVRETALRRRVAERALFIADPTGPVSLSDLLAAPLPPEASTPLPGLPVGATAASGQPGGPDIDTPATPRNAAVAALLGELPADAGRASRIPAAAVPEARPLPAEAVNTSASPRGGPEMRLTEAWDPRVAVPEVVSGPVEQSGAPHPAAGADSQVPQPAPREMDPVAMSVARYAPYSAAMVGPLPYLAPAVPPANGAQPVAEVERSAPSGPDTPEAIVPVTCAPGTEDPARYGDAQARTLPEQPDPEPVDVSSQGTDAPETAVADVEPDPPLPDTLARSEPAGLVLTPFEDSAELPRVRPLWSPEERGEPETAADTGLFGEELGLAQGGGAILRHETEPAAPARFDWSETGAFVIMGAVGLTSFGAAMAAFRLASEQNNGGTETAMIAWVLALIGAACVGVSSFNLYRRWGLPGGD
jgi:lysozyme